MSSPQVVLPTITGVDIQLRIAGPGSRSYAFIIDWHFRLLMAVAWFAIGLLIMRVFFATADGDAGDADIALMNRFLWLGLPPLLIYFLYHPVLEIIMRGRTPGKRIAGVRLVTLQGDTPGIGALLLRNVFRLLDSLPFAYLLGLLVVFFTEQHVRVGDLAAGTLLVVDHDNTASSFALARSAQSGGLTPEAADLVHELLDRWTALEPQQRAEIARALLQRVAPSIEAAELTQLDAAGLRARLAALIDGNPR